MTSRELLCDLCGDNAAPQHLHARCHLTAPLRAELEAGVLTLYCYHPACNRVVTRMPVAVRDHRQAKIFTWTQAAFTVEQATSLPQRGLRLLEEAVEAYQAVGGDPAMAHRLVDFVFSRPVGELGQELGGISVCLLALAAAAGLSADAEEQREVARVLAKPVEEFQRRNAAKNAAGFLSLDPPRDGDSR